MITQWGCVYCNTDAVEQSGTFGYLVPYLDWDKIIFISSHTQWNTVEEFEAHKLALWGNPGSRTK